MNSNDINLIYNKRIKSKQNVEYMYKNKYRYNNSFRHIYGYYAEVPNNIFTDGLIFPHIYDYVNKK